MGQAQVKRLKGRDLGKTSVNENHMRNVISDQLQLGETNISAIVLDPKSRDDIPHLLRGLQYIYMNRELRTAVFSILKEMLPPRVKSEGLASPNRGRPGMAQWNILVLGVLRLGLNADYDRIHELANQHMVIRQMLGHSDWADASRYELQTIKDNLRLFTPDILDRINQEVVRAGHRLLNVSAAVGLNARCDSFVVETEVHFPTDTNLLFDAIRKTIQICAFGCMQQGWSEWRQVGHITRKLKMAYRHIQKLKHSTSKDEDKRQAKQKEIELAHEVYLEHAETYLARAHDTHAKLAALGTCGAVCDEIAVYMGHARRQIDQIRRRVLKGERIPHGEKVFSIFQPHTEWISKGKAGVPVELGLRVCVIEDQYRFVLHHQVMEKVTDDQVAVPMVQQAKKRFGTLKSASFDKGFHSPANQIDLKEHLEQVVLPRKGRPSAAEKERMCDPEFRRLRHKHSAVESAINALEVHGLDICPDHGIDGFKRYVGLAVLARNIQRLGVIIREQEARRRGPYKKAA